MGVLAQHLTALVERLRKEVSRSERGTVAVGGITKAGNALEQLLKESVFVSYQIGQRELDAMLRQQRVLGGSKTYLHLLEQQPCAGIRDPEDRRIVAAVVNDSLMGKRSRLKRLAEVRNANNHPESAEADLSKAVQVMRDVLRWIEAQAGS